MAAAAAAGQGAVDTADPASSVAASSTGATATATATATPLLLAAAAATASSASKEADLYSSNRKMYSRAASWASRSAAPSPRTSNAGGGVAGAGVAAAAAGAARGGGVLLERQASSKGGGRASLPPLQPLAVARRSLERWPKAASDDAPDDVALADWSSPSTPGRRRVKTAPDIKIDLASLQRTGSGRGAGAGSLEPSEIQLKRDKFAFFDKECSRVSRSHIYLGSDAVAKNLHTLKSNGITHVLNCVGFVCPEYFKKDFVYKTLWLQDSPGEDITSLLYDVFDYFEEVREQGGRVFVHCCQGVSRSTSLVIAYIMWRDRLSFEDAFQDVKASRGVTNPNMGFACQLLQCQKRVHAAPMSPNSILRMYRLAPHSPYDPLHLVPKMVNNPGPGALDSRGAFVIHVPFAIYIWVGARCDPKISRAACMAAEQVIRYERVGGGPPIIVSEASESPAFWYALTKYAANGNDPAQDIPGSDQPAANKDQKEGGDMCHRSVGVGHRLVSEYSADFELFQRAKQGGVVPPVPSTGLGVVVPPTRIPAREDGWCRLRRKFLSGELVPPKDNSPVLSHEKLDTNAGSPNDPSLDSCSPFSSSSSSDNAVSCDSPFASPLSQLSISSPSMPDFFTPHPFEEDDAASGFSTPKSVQDQGVAFPLNKGTPPPTLNSKLPSILLARRKGDNPSHHSNSHDDSSSSTSTDFVIADDPSRESNSRFNQGTCAVDKGSFDGTMDHEKNGPEFQFGSPTSSSSSSSSSSASSSTSCLMAILKSGHSALYAWPRVERIDMFEVADLEAKSVFVLISPRGTQGYVVYLWIGRECNEQKEDDEMYWQSIAQEFLKQLECGERVIIRVTKQGHEPDEFWDNFNNG